MSEVPSTSTSSPNFETIFTAALEEYKKQTKKDIASHPLAAELNSCDSPNAVLTVLQTQVQTFGPSESANERWTKLLDPTVTVLYTFSTFLNNAVGPIFPPAAAIFTGISVLLQAVKDVRASQDVIIELFRRMEFFFKRLEAYIKVRPTTAMMDIIVQIVVEVISILGVVTKEIRQGRIKKYLKTLFGIKRVEDALQRLDKLTQEEARMAQTETLTITHRIDENVIHVGENVEGVNEETHRVHMKVENVSDQLQSVQANVQGVGEEVGLISTGVMEATVEIQLVSKRVSDLNREESRKDLRKWIAPPDPSSNFNTASEAHHEGTAAWCTTGNTFADWRTSGSLLWIHGKPGSGKTILSSVIIRDIESMSNASSAFLAYFYFDFKDTGKQDSRALLSSLLDQLSNQSDQFHDVLRGLYSEHRDGSQKPNHASLLRCLKGMLTTAGPVPIYLVIDALDECPNDTGLPSPRERVLDLVEELVKLRHPNMRLCITSRPELDIRVMLEPLASQRLSLHDESGQEQDIINYVTFTVRSDKKMKRWRDDEKNMVIDKLTEKADGMFRWVFCQLEVLRHCFPNNLRFILEELPKSLDETYKRILKDIINNHKEAHRLLQCLAVASRPLRVEELAEVLALDFNAGGIPTFNTNWLWEDHEAAVLSACSSLVSVIIDDGYRVVQFSHFSVKEFLTSDRLANCMEDVSRFHISFEPSHVILAQACLAVLFYLDDRTDEMRVRSIPLYRYAADYWVQHARIGNVEVVIKDAMDWFFDTDKPHLFAFIRLERNYHLEEFMVASDEGPRGMLSSAVPLYFAALYGFCGLAERLLTKQPQAIDVYIQGTTPLHLSVKGGHIEVTRLLIAHGANINSRSADNMTPLHVALHQGHHDIGKWLLNCGADVNFQEKSGLTALHLAARTGHLEISRMLIQRHADVHVQDNRGNTSLHFAASGGCLEISRMILELKPEVNSRNDDGYTPLLTALETNNPGIARLLLDHNVDVDGHGNSGNTTLHFAASRGYLEIAHKLLELKANVNSRNDYGSTPLLMALVTNKPDVAQLLLDHSADVDGHDNGGDTPLHFAASRGYIEVAHKLLEFKANVNSQNSRGFTPLLLALVTNNPGVAQLFLHHSADVHVNDNSGNTPLHFAAQNEHLEICRLLLQRNVEVNSQNHHKSTPLLLASECGTPDIVQLLLDHNADVHACDNDGDTPLHCAVLGGLNQLEVARLLLRLNLEVNSRNKMGLTPSHLALVTGNLDVARFLLNHNPDVDVHDNSGNTPLHFAASKGYLEIAHKLLELKANVNPRNDCGSTPLLITLETDNPDIARLFLDHNADVDVHDNGGNTPLHFAAQNEHLEICRLLLQRNVEVNSQNHHRSTPLLLASECGTPDIVQLLLDHNADVHARDNDGDTLLHCAVLGGLKQLEVSRLLLRLNTEVNSRNKMGSTPLHLASAGYRGGQPEIVQLLLDNGADMQARNFSGETASDVARGPKWQEIVQLLSLHAAE